MSVRSRRTFVGHPRIPPLPLTTVLLLLCVVCALSGRAVRGASAEATEIAQPGWLASQAGASPLQRFIYAHKGDMRSLSVDRLAGAQETAPMTAAMPDGARIAAPRDECAVGTPSPAVQRILTRVLAEAHSAVPAEGLGREGDVSTVPAPSLSPSDSGAASSLTRSSWCPSCDASATASDAPESDRDMDGDEMGNSSSSSSDRERVPHAASSASGAAQPALDGAPRRTGRYLVVGIHRAAGTAVVQDHHSPAADSPPPPRLRPPSRTPVGLESESRPATEDDAAAAGGGENEGGDDAHVGAAAAHSSGARRFPCDELRTALADLIRSSAGASGGAGADTADPTATGPAVEAHSSVSASAVAAARLGAHASARVRGQSHRARADPAPPAAPVRPELHVIDRDYVLVYLPAELSSSRAAAAAAAAVPREHPQWDVLDVFQTPEGQALKLSEVLYPIASSRAACKAAFLEEWWTGAIAAACAGEPLDFGSPLGQRRLSLSVWTAEGEAANVLAQLHSSGRLAGAEGQANAEARVAHRRPLQGAPCATTLRHVSDGRIDVELDMPTACDVAGDPRAVPPTRVHTVAKVTCACLQVVRVLASHPAVRWVEPRPPGVEPLNSRATATIQLGCGAAADPAAAAARSMWAMGLNGTGEIIAISDTGVDVESCYFRDPTEPVAFYPEVNHHHRKVLSYHHCSRARRPWGRQLWPQQGHPFDQVAGHGTHVAGSAAGFAVADTGEAASYNGVATGAKLYVRALNCSVVEAGEDGATGAATAVAVDTLPLPRDITELFSTPYRIGARISSNSWGFRPETRRYSAVERLVDGFVERHDDMLVLFAVGNVPKAGLYSPGAAKNVLTVGAHLNGLTEEELDTVAAFSASGPTYDHRRKPDLVGPGGIAVQSARAAGAPGEAQCGRVSKTGTSMATGLVAGGAALVREFARERLGLAAPSAALLRAMLLHGTVRLPPALVDRSGFGRADLSLVLGPNASAAASGSDKSRDSGSGTYGVYGDSRVWVRDRLVLHDRETLTFCFTATPASDSAAATGKPESRALKATLAWTDPATAVEGSLRSLVHDLDLLVVDTDGRLYYPHPTNASIRYADRYNNVEQVRVANVTESLARLFRVVVYGEDVQTSAGQAFSLVVSAPGLVARASCTDGAPALAPAHCPGNCTGGGVCETASMTCRCSDTRRFVDCSRCNEEVVCNRRGSCALSPSGAARCTCRPGSHFRDAHCSVCAEGWYGPLCDSQCKCQHGSTCDKTTGRCMCRQDLNYGGQGCFQGAQCQYCCEGFGGPECNVRSYWCDSDEDAIVSVDDPDGGYVQVNGFGVYPHSVTCMWNITALPYHRIELQYIRYDIESVYDALYLYDFGQNLTSTWETPGSQSRPPRPADTFDPGKYLLRKDSGQLSEADSFVVRSTGRSLFLVFESDWAGAREGFLLRYSLLPVSRCTRSCPSRLPQVPADALTCGEEVGLLDWCLCRMPYVGWNCNITGLTRPSDRVAAMSAPVRGCHSTALAPGRAGVGEATAAPPVSRSDAGNSHRHSANSRPGVSPVLPVGPVRPSNHHLVSESLLTLDVLPTVPAADEHRITLRAITRVPLVVNGYTLVNVQSVWDVPPAALAYDATSAEGEAGYEWVVDLTIVPFTGTGGWLTEVPGLTLGVQYVHKLRAELLSSTVSEIQLLDLYSCPDAPTPSFRAPLRVPPDVRAPGGNSSVQLEAQVLVMLLWNATEAAPWPITENVYIDTVVMATAVTYTRVPGPDAASASAPASTPAARRAAREVDVHLTCASPAGGLVVGTGQRVKRPERPAPPHARRNFVSAAVIGGSIAGCCALGVVMGALSVRWSFPRALGLWGAYGRAYVLTSSSDPPASSATGTSSRCSDEVPSDQDVELVVRPGHSDGRPALGGYLVEDLRFLQQGSRGLPHTQQHRRRNGGGAGAGGRGSSSGSHVGSAGMFRSVGGAAAVRAVGRPHPPSLTGGYMDATQGCAPSPLPSPSTMGSGSGSGTSAVLVEVPPTAPSDVVVEYRREGPEQNGLTALLTRRGGGGGMVRYSPSSSGGVGDKKGV